SMLYGARIIIGSAFASEVFCVLPGFRQWTVALITYVINIPSSQLVRQLMGEGWKRSLTWVARAQVALAVFGVASDLMQGRPMTLGILNRGLVIATMAVFVLNVVRVDLSATPAWSAGRRPMRVLAGGLAVFMTTVVAENVTRSSSRGLWLEPAGFLCFLCSLAYAVGRAIAL